MIVKPFIFFFHRLVVLYFTPHKTETIHDFVVHIMDWQYFLLLSLISCITIGISVNVRTGTGNDHDDLK